MTYNFDPDKWLDDEIFMLDHQLKLQKITLEEYDRQIEILEKKHLEMWERLDGTYQIDSNPSRVQKTDKET